MRQLAEKRRPFRLTFSVEIEACRGASYQHARQQLSSQMIQRRCAAFCRFANHLLPPGPPDIAVGARPETVDTCDIDCACDPSRGLRGRRAENRLLPAKEAEHRENSGFVACRASRTGSFPLRLDTPEFLPEGNAAPGRRDREPRGPLARPMRGRNAAALPQLDY
jgi:hypothetical protein